ncbi:MAG: hypothetical protein COA86_07605 [Kangiella sp.]|nr:MAG: hypothetical protein COA86_07605 [Kangiella sp.]
MTTRTKLKERSIRIKKNRKLIKRLLIIVSALALIWLTVESFNRTNTIVISNTNYDCKAKGCDYSFTVKNLSNNTVEGYARITVFKAFNISAINSSDVLSTERIEYSLNANEKKIIAGFYVTGIEADKLTIGVGEINASSKTKNKNTSTN